ncbi:hypothetical protein AMATHDRAFT_66 [Amanita thiersii Skay4041]|uniref:Extracellular membrane protein CFEM domain-containing protein n=1 Tax=Amanita thiersii Skay4041 TaxID=703135 RepID=A0A2A9P0C1_9AGAR|nr:hypothetical protein AMATHDRAFT_66 [Amanita thiersii Skay4041]
MTRLSLPPLLLLFLSSLFLSAQCVLNKWEATSFCKCIPNATLSCIASSLNYAISPGICFQSNYSIQRLNIPDNPSQPCLSCTKQWCLNQNLPICRGASLGEINPDTATGKEGDVEARCFQRDSPRDQLVVTLFLLTVFGLLLGAGVKSRIERAGLAAEMPWNAGRRWWEAWIPRRPEDFGFGRLNGGRETERGGYSERLRSDIMGSLCSKPGTHSGERITLAPSQSYGSRPQNGSASRPSDLREAAAAAAEQRLKTAQARGTNASNAQQGKLASQLASQKKYVPEQRQEEQLVWD